MSWQALSYLIPYLISLAIFTIDFLPNWRYNRSEALSWERRIRRMVLLEARMSLQLIRDRDLLEARLIESEGQVAVV